MISGSTLCTSFKRELLTGVHDFLTQTFRLALYGETASLDATTTVYVPGGEISGPGYTAGGQILTSPQVLQVANVGYATFADAIWPNASLTAFGALLYNDTMQQRAVGVLNFGGPRASNSGNFRVMFPPPGPGTALVRIA
jgi:hypothetical protein